MHAGGRRFDPAWLHHLWTKARLLSREFWFCHKYLAQRNADRGQNLEIWAARSFYSDPKFLLFNNMVVLSRAFWVQDDSECDCDDHTIYPNEHKTVSAKQASSVVEMSVGVSPVELSRFHCGLTQNFQEELLPRLYNVALVNLVHFGKEFLFESRRSASETPGA